MAAVGEIVRRVVVRGTQEGVDKAAAALRDLAGAEGDVVVKTERMEKATLSVATKLNRLSMAVDEEYRSNQQLAKALATVDAARSQGLISTARAAQLSELAAARYRTEGDAALKAANGGVRTLHWQTGNLAAQFQDIAVQLQGGQSPFTVALQQGTQVAAVLGPMGAAGAAASLGEALLSLISPMSLITIGTIAAGGAIVQWLGGLNKEAPAAEDRLKAHADWLNKILVGYEAAKGAANSYISSTDKLPVGVVKSDLQGSLSSSEGNYAGQIAEAARKQAELNALTARWVELRAASAQQFPDDSARLERFDALIGQAHQLSTLEVNAKTSNAELERVMTTARELQRVATEPAIKGLAGDVYNLASGLRDTRAEIDATSAALGTLQGKAFRGLGVGEALSSIKSMTPETRTDQQVVGDLFKAAAPQARTTSELQALADAVKTYNDAVAAVDAQKKLDEGTAAANRQASAFANVMATLQLQTQAVGLNARETEKLNQVKAAGVAVDSSSADAIRAQVDQLYNARDALDAVKKAQQDAKDAAKEWAGVTSNFIEGVVSGLRSGKSGWQSFADSALSALDRIAQKILETQIENAILSAFGGGNYIGGTPGAPPLQLGYQVGVATGGYIRGPGTGTSDSIAARLSNGEFVINANATRAHRPLLEAINHSVPAFAGGGAVGKVPGWVRAPLSAAASQNSGDGLTVNVQIERRPGASGEQDSASATRNGNSIDVKAIIIDTTARAAQEPGTALNRALKVNLGAKQQLTRRG